LDSLPITNKVIKRKIQILQVQLQNQMH